MRGAWLVGPMNRPEKRYDSDGWSMPVQPDCSSANRAAQERAVGRAAAEHHVVAAAGARVAAVDLNFVGAEPRDGASS